MEGKKDVEESLEEEETIMEKLARPFTLLCTFSHAISSDMKIYVLYVYICMYVYRYM